MKAFNLGWQLEQHPLHTDLNGNYSTDPSGKGKHVLNTLFLLCVLTCSVRLLYVFFSI